MEFRYGDMVKIRRKDEYGGMAEKRYKVVDKMIADDRDLYLLQDERGALRGWHSANRMVKVEGDENA